MSLTILRGRTNLVDDPLRLASCGRPVAWVEVALLDDRKPAGGAGEPGRFARADRW